MAAASSSSRVALKYDVFLSFSGQDTRKGFTSTLCDFLRNKGIETFIDDGLPRGEQIETSLMRIIEESMIAVVIFSEKYASSSWCLDELLKIKECNLVIKPIFYKVKPDDVGNLSGKFGEEFAKLKLTKNQDKIKKWTDHLTFASTQSGWAMDNYRKEIDVINEIAASILKYLDSVYVSTCSGEFSHNIGIASLVDDLKRLLTNDSSKVQFLGLWGMGGIGKTTIAEALYYQLAAQFDERYFCSIALDVKEISTLVSLRNKIISHILKEPFDEGTPNQLPHLVRLRLQKKKVLIVVDNVSTSNQLTTLVGSKTNPWFATGSKIIITSRDSKALENEDVTVYPIKEMSKHYSLRLFCLHAFKQNQPLDGEDYLKWSNSMIEYTKGLPLAIKVLGRHLYRRTKDEWRSTIETLETCIDSEIHDALLISYNALSEIEKEIFLDIACFFKGYEKDRVKDILNGCGFNSTNGIAHLNEKCLVTLNEDNTLQMHDLIQKMGWDIVEGQSRSGMCKRICKSSDSWNLLTSYQDAKTFEETTKAIEGIFVNMNENGIERLIIHPMAFSRLQKLRLLMFHDKQSYRLGFPKIEIYSEPVCSPFVGFCSLLNCLSQSFKDCYHQRIFNNNGGVQYFPNDLRLLHWDGYSGAHLPSSFSAENLIELHLQDSNLKQLWKEVKETERDAALIWYRKNLHGYKHQNSINLKSLKVLNLGGSDKLTTLPDLTSATKLEKIILDACISLHEIPASIQHLQCLSFLSLQGCCRLYHLPSLLNIRTLRKLYLFECRRLIDFPETSEDIEELDLNITSVVLWPDSMSYLNNLKCLSLPRSLQKLPCTLHLNSLEILDFSRKDIHMFPKIIGHLRRVKLEWTKIRELPASIVLLSSLVELDLTYCCELKTLPNNFGQLNCLKKLMLSGCKMLFERPLVLSGLNSIKKLYLDNCGLREFPVWVCTLLSLQLLDLSSNNFTDVPDSIRQLSLLKDLNLSSCKNLRSLPTELLSLMHDSNVSVSGLLEAEPSSYKGVEEPHSVIDSRFCFGQCDNLSDGARRNIVEKAMMRIQHIAYKKDEVLGCTLTASLPEYEIPECFKRYKGRSITIELPVDLSSSIFRGFVLGIVVNSDSSAIMFDWGCKKADGSDLVAYGSLFDIGGRAKTDTLCFYYISSTAIQRDYGGNLEDATHATFTFRSSKGKVSKCGVHIVCAELEAQQSKSNNIVDSVATTDEGKSHN